MSKDGVFLPEFTTALPENFTFEFDLLTNTELSFYSTTFNVIMANLPTTKDFTKWARFKHDSVSGIEVNFHPMNAGSSQGRIGHDIYEKSNYSEVKNETNTSQFFAKVNNYAKISIW